MKTTSTTMTLSCGEAFGAGHAAKAAGAVRAIYRRAAVTAGSGVWRGGRKGCHSGGVGGGKGARGGGRRGEEAGMRGCARTRGCAWLWYVQGEREPGRIAAAWAR